MNAPTAQHGSARGDRVALGAAALICISAFFGIASGNRETYRLRAYTYSHYNLLVDGFLSGHLYMDLTPATDAERSGREAAASSYRMHDTSLFNGKYYLYFGVAPAVVLFLPWKVLTGSHLPQYWAAAIFASLGYLAAVALLGRLRREHFPGLSRGLLFLGALLLGIISWWPLLLGRVGVWEIPIASAYCFACLTVLLIHRSVRDGRATWWLAAASLAYGLAVGSRPNYVLGTAVLALPLLYLWRRERPSPEGSRVWAGRLCAAVIPVAGVGALLAAYNYLRFGSALEFGTRYMVLQGPLSSRTFSFSYVGTNLYLYLLAPAHFSPWFPFFKLSRIPALPEGYSAIPEDMYGVVANMPVLALSVAGMALLGARRGLTRLRLAVAAMMLLVVAVGGVLMLFYGANSRYAVDVMCGLPVLTILGIWSLESRAGGARRAARAVWVVLAGYSVFFAFCAGVGRDEIFRGIHPRAYRALAHAFDLPSFWYDRIRGVEYGPVSLSVRFPEDKMGTNEPLLVTGWGPWSNLLYVHYADAGHIQIGFVGASGPLLSVPLRISYAAAHSLKVSMGSFYPPREHPFFDSLGAKDARALSDTLFVAVDGVTVLLQPAYFFDAVARKPELGRGPDLPGRQWVFTGEMTGG